MEDPGACSRCGRRIHTQSTDEMEEAPVCAGCLTSEEDALETLAFVGACRAWENEAASDESAALARMCAQSALVNLAGRLGAVALSVSVDSMSASAKSGDSPNARPSRSRNSA